MAAYGSIKAMKAYIGRIDCPECQMQMAVADNDGLIQIACIKPDCSQQGIVYHAPTVELELVEECQKTP